CRDRREPVTFTVARYYCGFAAAGRLGAPRTNTVSVLTPPAATASIVEAVVARAVTRHRHGAQDGADAEHSDLERQRARAGGDEVELGAVLVGHQRGDVA